MAMTPDEIKKYYSAIKNDLNDQDVINESIDLAAKKNLSVNEINCIPELFRFFGGEEDDSWSDFLSRGLSSLRVGFYKICQAPFLNTSIHPNTFSASVYYFHPNNENLIKYQANIGPMTNIHAGYNALPGTVRHESAGVPYIPVLQKFANEKNIIGTAKDHYYVPKLNFFNSIYKDEKVFYVTNSIYDPDFIHSNPRPKKVSWSFID